MVFGCSCNKTIEYRNVNLRNCFYNFYSIVLDVSLFTKTDTRRPVSLRQLRGALYSYRVHLIPLISMSATKQQSFAPPPPPHSGAAWLQLRADFELDKGKAVSRALANVQRETERARRQAGERSGDELRDEMARLAAKHRSDVSASKKKQWVSHGGAGGRGGGRGAGAGGGGQGAGGGRSGDELRDEMARLAAKHHSDVSASKKKQWVSHGGRGAGAGRWGGGGGGTQRVGGRGPSSLRQIESLCSCSVECC